MDDQYSHIALTSSKLHELKTLFKTSKAIDSNTNWIYINRIWYDPIYRNKFIPHIDDFLDTSISKITNPTIFVPEGLSSSFGTIPFASNYAQKKGYPMFFWKEFGDILTIAPFVFPQPESIDLPKSINLVIIQDVVGNGSLLYKIARDLIKYDHKWIIRSLLTFVYLSQFNKELNELLERVSEEQKSNIQFDYMVSDLEIRG